MFFFAILIAFILIQFANEKPKVVVVLKELNTKNQFWDIVKAGAEKGFRDFDIDGKVIAPSNEDEVNGQEKILKNVLKEKPDVLIVSLIDVTRISI
ncbi:type 1 periplasmic-binding domain-containing protein [Metabacillus arenae]|uniref:Sugar ABC transporter substrate-binding protein n=1 Tax=Metabacillus arenae TaxID=2771434 RepID=A0A926NCI1_9BACI|nr:hypothetical protein [Metabacillus arenae]MBD1381742.1 hypothetical protein [Metabacillus arenae]